jgi:hypothetical protein
MSLQRNCRRAAGEGLTPPEREGVIELISSLRNRPVIDGSVRFSDELFEPDSITVGVRGKA